MIWNCSGQFNIAGKLFRKLPEGEKVVSKMRNNSAIHSNLTQTACIVYC